MDLGKDTADERWTIHTVGCRMNALYTKVNGMEEETYKRKSVADLLTFSSLYSLITFVINSVTACYAPYHDDLLILRCI